MYRVIITREDEVEVPSGDATLSDIDLDGLPEQVSLVASTILITRSALTMSLIRRR